MFLNIAAVVSKARQARTSIGQRGGKSMDIETGSMESGMVGKGRARPHQHYDLFVAYPWARSSAFGFHVFLNDIVAPFFQQRSPFTSQPEAGGVI